jgi:hypothetical protein
MDRLCPKCPRNLLDYECCGCGNRFEERFDGDLVRVVDRGGNLAFGGPGPRGFTLRTHLNAALNAELRSRLTAESTIR